MHVAIIQKEGKTHFVTKDGRLSVDPKRAFLSGDEQGLLAHLDEHLLNPGKFVLTHRLANDEQADAVVVQIVAKHEGDSEAIGSKVTELAAVTLENLGWPILATHLRKTLEYDPSNDDD
jgi:hypothetical protein